VPALAHDTLFHCCGGVLQLGSVLEVIGLRSSVWVSSAFDLICFSAFTLFSCDGGSLFLLLLFTLLLAAAWAMSCFQSI
jgi:hypothetical protein